MTPTQLTATILSADISVGGSLSVTVVTSAPDGGTSNAANFTVNNPLPTMGSIAPTSAAAGGGALTLTVNGGNFVSTSTVRWNGRHLRGAG